MTGRGDFDGVRLVVTGGVIGWDFAVGRLVAAMVISVLAGLLMAALFRDHDRKNADGAFAAGQGGDVAYSNTTILTFFLLQLAILVVFGLSIDPVLKGVLIVSMIAAVLGIVFFTFKKEHNLEWLRETWDLTAVLYAVRPDRGYFGLSQPGTIGVDERAITQFAANVARFSHRWLRDRILSMTSHATVTAFGAGMTGWQALRGQALANPLVEAAAPFVEGEALLVELERAAMASTLRDGGRWVARV